MTEISVNVLLALSKRGCTKKIYTINVLLQEALHCPFGDCKISLYTFRWLLFHCHCKRSRFFVWDSCKINQLDKNISRYCCHLLCWSSKSFPLKLKGSFFIPGASFLLFHAKDNYNEISFRNNLTSKRTQGHSTLFGLKMHGAVGRCLRLSKRLRYCSHPHFCCRGLWERDPSF